MYWESFGIFESLNFRTGRVDELLQRTEGKGPGAANPDRRTDKQIDRMVYALYGVTEEDMAVPEGRESN